MVVMHGGAQDDLSVVVRSGACHMQPAGRVLELDKPHQEDLVEDLVLELDKPPQEAVQMDQVDPVEALEAQEALETQLEVLELESFHAQSFQADLGPLRHDGILFRATTHRIELLDPDAQCDAQPVQSCWRLQHASGRQQPLQPPQR